MKLHSLCDQLHLFLNCSIRRLYQSQHPTNLRFSHSRQIKHLFLSLLRTRSGEVLVPQLSNQLVGVTKSTQNSSRHVTRVDDDLLCRDFSGYPEASQEGRVDATTCTGIREGVVGVVKLLTKYLLVDLNQLSTLCTPVTLIQIVCAHKLVRCHETRVQILPDEFLVQRVLIKCTIVGNHQIISHKVFELFENLPELFSMLEGIVVRDTMHMRRTYREIFRVYHLIEMTILLPVPVPDGGDRHDATRIPSPQGVSRRLGIELTLTGRLRVPRNIG